MRHTSLAMSVLLYSKWCLSMMEEPWSLARGWELLQNKRRFENKLKTRLDVDARNILQALNKRSWLALSGRGCWSLCGRYHGRKQQPPWQRHLDQSSTSSASLSAGKSWIIMCRYSSVRYDCTTILICSMFLHHLNFLKSQYSFQFSISYYNKYWAVTSLEFVSFSVGVL